MKPLGQAWSSTALARKDKPSLVLAVLILQALSIAQTKRVPVPSRGETVRAAP